MKRYLVVALAFAIVIILSAGAIAIGPGYGKGMGKGPMWSNLTNEDAQKLSKFQSETLPLRQKMLEIRTEMIQLRAQTPVDWDAISEKQQEMIDLRTEIQKKASEYGISGCGNCNDGCRNPMGMGRMMM